MIDYILFIYVGKITKVVAYFRSHEPNTEEIANNMQSYLRTTCDASGTCDNILPSKRTYGLLPQGNS